MHNRSQTTAALDLGLLHWEQDESKHKSSTSLWRRFVPETAAPPPPAFTVHEAQAIVEFLGSSKNGTTILDVKAYVIQLDCSQILQSQKPDSPSKSRCKYTVKMSVVDGNGAGVRGPGCFRGLLCGGAPHPPRRRVNSKKVKCVQ